MRRESPLEYIEKHREGADEERVEAAKKNLSKPIGKIEFSNQGDVALENKPFSLTFKYSEVAEDAPAIFVSRGIKLELGQVREIKDLYLIRSDREKSISFSEIMPGDFKIFMALENDISMEWSDFVDLGQKRIILNGDISAPGTLLALLHETGHIKAASKQEVDTFSPEPNSDRHTIDADDIAKKLLNERDAWAYALKIMKPLLDREKGKGFSILEDDVLTYAKSECLKSYSDLAAQQIGTRSSMHHFAMDIMDDIDRDGYYEDLES